MTDYRKFDNIYDSDDSEEEREMEQRESMSNDSSSSSDASRGIPTMIPPITTSNKTKKGSQGRFKFEHEGNTIYEWEQSLEEVNIYITPPPGIHTCMMCTL